MVTAGTSRRLRPFSAVFGFLVSFWVFSSAALVLPRVLKLCRLDAVFLGVLSRGAEGRAAAYTKNTGIPKPKPSSALALLVPTQKAPKSAKTQNDQQKAKTSAA